MPFQLSKQAKDEINAFQRDILKGIVYFLYKHTEKSFSEPSRVTPKKSMFVE